MLRKGDSCFVNGRPAVFEADVSENACSVRFPYRDGSLSELRIVSRRKVSRDLTQSIVQSRTLIAR